MTDFLSQATKSFYSELIGRSSAPDEPLSEIPEDTTVFVDRGGNPTCRYGDPCWAPPGQRHKWYWYTSGPQQCPMYPQAKRLMFHILYHPYFQSTALSTLRCYYFALRALAGACHRQGVHEIGTFFSDDRAAQLLLDDILKNHGYSSFVQAGTSLFNAFHMFGEDIVGFKTYRRTVYQKLGELLTKKNQDSFQHPVIPWRIYKHLIVSVSRQVEASLEWLDDPAWTAAIRFHSTEKRTYPSKTVKYIKAEFPEFYEKVSTMPALMRELGSMQELARLGILLLTGCRTDEVSRLEVREPEKVDESTYLIHGRTTKSKKGKVYWVTNDIGANAVKLALKVRRVISEGLALEPSADLPIMPCIGNFPNKIRKQKSNDYKYNRKRGLHVTTVNGVLDRLGISLPDITQEDYDFLSELAKDSNIDLDKFSVGSVFPFSAHQFRRSLAYFVLRSARIDIGAFKRQFKHLLVAMTRYYSSGVISAELQPDLALIELLTEEQLLEIDERLRRHLVNFTELKGAMGASIRRNLEESDEESFDEVLEIARNRLLKRVEQGEIQYRETPLGACLSTEPCLSRARAEVSACLDCKNAILEMPKIEKTYRLLQNSDHPMISAQAEHFSYFLSGNESRPVELEGKLDD